MVFLGEIISQLGSAAVNIALPESADVANNLAVNFDCKSECIIRFGVQNDTDIFLRVLFRIRVGQSVAQIIKNFSV